jgi:hypothetical protein
MFDCVYCGSLTEFHGRGACASPDPSAPGRYVLRLWDDPMGFTQNETLRHVRRQSFQVGVFSRGPGFTCRCGLDHERE